MRLQLELKSSKGGDDDDVAAEDNNSDHHEVGIGADHRSVGSKMGVLQRCPQAARMRRRIVLVSDTAVVRDMFIM